MPTVPTAQLLRDLQTGLESISERVQALAAQPSQVLTQPPATGGWSAAQVLDHLNFYSRAYDGKLEAAIRRANSNGATPATTYQSGWLGDYFVKLMLPKPDGNVRSKMKAPGASVPPPALNGATVLADFGTLQAALLTHVREAGAIRPDRVRVATMLPLISLRLGDALRFLLAHQERHLAQAERAAAAARQA